jgi:hypothetical protein
MNPAHRPGLQRCRFHRVRGLRRRRNYGRGLQCNIPVACRRWRCRVDQRYPDRRRHARRTHHRAHHEQGEPQVHRRGEQTGPAKSRPAGSSPRIEHRRSCSVNGHSIRDLRSAICTVGATIRTCGVEYCLIPAMSATRIASLPPDTCGGTGVVPAWCAAGVTRRRVSG